MRDGGIARTEKLLRDYAMSYPEATEAFPWGERAIKVRDRTFVFMSNGHKDLSLSVKLPRSREFALELPFTEPTHYGLGRHGWVTACFEPGDDLPLDQLKRWIDESYRAIAPKGLAAKVVGGD